MEVSKYIHFAWKEGDRSFEVRCSYVVKAKRFSMLAYEVVRGIRRPVYDVEELDPPHGWTHTFRMFKRMDDVLHPSGTVPFFLHRLEVAVFGKQPKYLWLGELKKLLRVNEPVALQIRTTHVATTDIRQAVEKHLSEQAKATYDWIMAGDRMAPLRYDMTGRNIDRNLLDLG